MAALQYDMSRFGQLPFSFGIRLVPREKEMFCLLQFCANHKNKAIVVKGRLIAPLAGFLSLVATYQDWTGLKCPKVRRRALRGLAAKGIITYQSTNYGTSFQILQHPKNNAVWLGSITHQVNRRSSDPHYSKIKQRWVGNLSPQNGLKVMNFETTRAYLKDLEVFSKPPEGFFARWH